MSTGTGSRGDLESVIPKRDHYAYQLHRINAFTSAAVDAALNRMPCLTAGSRGLDVGCGVGIDVCKLARAVLPGGHVTGVDTARPFLKYAAARVDIDGLASSVTFREGDFAQLPFEDDTFDWAWSKDTLWQGNPDELARVVRPGGTVTLAFWTGHRLLAGYPFLESRLNATPEPHGPLTESAAPEEQVMRAGGWLRKAGLADVQAATFTAGVSAPLTANIREALTLCFEMLWGKAKGHVSARDWAAYLRLCGPDSPDFILDQPDYYAYVNYTVFSGKVPV
jgi:demethylmenaquinone methyltransferase / 2-methoxy-6-polyprenyl-1,4-benzoquinol methylase